jgi:Tfp pilus assembly protein PilN
VRAVNLLPRAEPRRKSAGLSLQAQLTTIAPVLVAVVLGAGWLVTRTQVKDHRTTLRALQQELAKLPPAKKPIPVDPSLKAEHDQRVLALAGALSQRVAWDRILRQISSILPEDVWLTGIDARSPGADAAPAAATETTPTSTEASSAAASSEAPPPPPPPPSTSDTSGSPLVIDGYTYSQEGVARFLARLSVIPDLQNVQLVSSELTDVAGRQVVKFTINADLAMPETS